VSNNTEGLAIAEEVLAGYKRLHVTPVFCLMDLQTTLRLPNERISDRNGSPEDGRDAS
jgi:hypothetical protein